MAQEVSVRVPQPRQLGESETIESLKHWKMAVRNYYRRDTYYKNFLDGTLTWDPNADNYGLTAEGENSVHNRSARELKDDLIAFLHLIAAYLPFSYVTERFEKNTNSLEQVFNIIAELYNAEVTNDSFLDLAHMIKLSTETHRQYFERLAAHVRQHLTGPQVSVENFNSGRTGDSMNITIMNMVVIIWLSKIDSRLI